MSRIIAAGAAALCILVTGCGEVKLRTAGRLVKDGRPFVPKEGESVRVTFVPIPPDGSPPADHYFAEFNKADGTFHSSGKDRKGMPPGKYRVAVEYKNKNKEDTFGGKFDENRSPYVFDIDARTTEIVIDLDKPPAQ
jgi:hypothetical protein